MDRALALQDTAARSVPSYPPTTVGQEHRLRRGHLRGAEHKAVVATNDMSCSASEHQPGGCLEENRSHHLPSFRPARFPSCPSLPSRGQPARRRRVYWVAGRFKERRERRRQHAAPSWQRWPAPAPRRKSATSGRSKPGCWAGDAEVSLGREPFGVSRCRCVAPEPHCIVGRAFTRQAAACHCPALVLDQVGKTMAGECRPYPAPPHPVLIWLA